MIKEHTEDWGKVAKERTMLYKTLNRAERGEKSRHCVHTCVGIAIAGSSGGGHQNRFIVI
jgi:hypothetical protein